MTEKFIISKYFTDDHATKIRVALPLVGGLPDSIYVATVSEAHPPKPFIVVDTGLYKSCKWLDAYRRGALRVSLFYQARTYFQNR